MNLHLYNYTPSWRTKEFADKKRFQLIKAGPNLRQWTRRAQVYNENWCYSETVTVYAYITNDIFDICWYLPIYGRISQTKLNYHMYAYLQKNSELISSLSWFVKTTNLTKAIFLCSKNANVIAGRNKNATLNLV